MASYCLRGEIDGRRLNFPLTAGDNHLGNLPDNDLTLTASGVSRRHAVVTLADGGVTVRDLGSKNGTFVNGRRVGSADLAAGDALEIGQVELRLETVDAEDAELGLMLAELVAPARAGGVPDGGTAGGLWTPPRETTEILGRRTGSDLASILPFLEEIVDRLSRRPRADPSGALSALVRRFQLNAAWLVEQEEGGISVVVASVGAAADGTLERGLSALAAATGSERELRGAHTAAFRRRGRPQDGIPRVAGAAVVRSDTAALGLVVAGRDLDRLEALLPTLVRWIDRFRSPSHEAPAASPAAGELVFPPGCVAGESPAMRALYRQMRPVSQGDLPVLILGDTGVGKEYLARTVHASSPRRDRPFVAVNCAAIPADLLESELFGIEKGVATGVGARPGKFRQAEGGTLFLDEIGDMSAGLQAKLLRALQEKEVQPVGGKPVPTDVRIVSATNTELKDRIDCGAFRRDLYYRLAGMTLRVPALAERREDLPALAEHFIRCASESAGRTVRGVTVKALRALLDHSWPGNVRELEHEIERLVYLCGDRQVIDSSMLSPEILDRRDAHPSSSSAGDAAPRPAAAAAAGAPALKIPVPEGMFRLAEIEKHVIEQALQASRGTQVWAARLLGISRDALRRRIERYGLEVPGRPGPRPSGEKPAGGGSGPSR